MLKINVITMVNHKTILYITQWYRTIEVRLCYRLALQERRHLGLVAHGRGGGGTRDHPEITIKPF